MSPPFKSLLILLFTAFEKWLGVGSRLGNREIICVFKYLDSKSRILGERGLFDGPLERHRSQGIKAQPCSYGDGCV